MDSRYTRNVEGRTHKDLVILFTLCSLVLYMLPSTIENWILLAARCADSRNTEPLEELEEEENESRPQLGVFLLWNAELSCAEPGPSSGLG